ncbi:MAG: 3-dehydroquinate synthase [Wenzhouxiangellaceae bacterium]|nr:3-dehydroquinate synthase [Wenzhouxiangellaceae bacterium]
MPFLELNHAKGQCRIQIGRGLVDQPQAWQRQLDSATLVVTDHTVAGFYLERLQQSLAAWSPATISLPPGEETKTLANWQAVLEKLAAIGAQRDATVLALGGGVIGDLAGFAAASYMRGIRVVQVPTTLLAQVDASIGGKTGVNLPAGKNLVGAFHQPHAVMIDVTTLTTLSERDYIAGLAEVVKYGAIRDAGFFDWLSSHAAGLLDREPQLLEEMVQRAVAHKIEVVESDELEAGQRALLNFGHTFAHAIETATDYQHYRHGEAVAIGMHLAARFSARLGLLDAAQAERLTQLLVAFGLPVSRPAQVTPETMVRHMRLDKKNRAGRIRLILLSSIGQASITDTIDEFTLLEFLNE